MKSNKISHLLSQMNLHHSFATFSRKAKSPRATYHKERKQLVSPKVAAAPFFQRGLEVHVKQNPFAIATDGSSDSDIEMMNPLLGLLISILNTCAPSSLTCACLPHQEEKDFFYNVGCLYHP